MGVYEPRVLHVPELVRRDTSGFRARVESFFRGEIDMEGFRPELAGMGIYEERTPGSFMVRIRVGAGRVLPRQLRLLVSLSLSHGSGVLRVTTRQDIQIHGVRLEDTPVVAESLLSEGLSCRGGGGNTVRNVTSCPRAGTCVAERFDVSPYAMAVAEYLLQRSESFKLPRKFKIAFSGCTSDCALASVADVGFFAEARGGRLGFRVYAGGGLGPNARGGVLIADFVPGKDCIRVAEAVRRVFDRLGDRTNRRRARLRYVLERLGEEAFAETVRRELETVTTECPDAPEVPPPAPGARVAAAAPFPQLCTGGTRVLAERRPGLNTIELRLPLGDIPAGDLIRVADVSEAYGEGLVRLSQVQDILVTGVPSEQLPPALAAMRGLSVGVNGGRSPKTVACAGASTCRIGLCRSRGLAEAIARRFEQEQPSAGEMSPTIRISGCPNSCGAHQIGEIGLAGRVQRVQGQLMPCYEVYFGGHLSADGARLGVKLGVVPAKRVPDLLARVYREGSTDAAGLSAVVSEFEALPEEVPSDWFLDFGAAAPFGKNR